MKKHSVEIYDSDKHSISISKNKCPIQSSRTVQNDNMNNTKDISQDLKDHFKSSKFEHLNDTLNDILMSMMRKDVKMLDFSRNRDSILHNVKLKNIEADRNSSIKDRKRSTSTDSQQSLSKKMNINSVKNIYLSRSPNTSMVRNHNNKSFYEREMINLEKKKLEIEAIKNQRRAEEMLINTNRPQLSKNSEKIINEKFKSQKPVYLRTADIIQMKKIEDSKFLQKYVTKLTENIEGNETLLRKKTPIKNKSQESGDSPVTRWLKRMELYNAKQEKKIEKIKLSNEQGEKDAESFPFKPVISKTSDLLAKMKLSNDRNNLNKSTHERLHEDKENRSKKLEKLIDENMPSFSPVINRHKQNYFYSGKISKRSLSKYLTQKSDGHNEIVDKKKNLKNDSVNMNLNEVNFTDFDVNDAGYKINIRNYSAWVKEKENRIVLSKAIPNTLKSLYCD